MGSTKSRKVVAGAWRYLRTVPWRTRHDEKRGLHPETGKEIHCAKHVFLCPKIVPEIRTEKAKYDSFGFEGASGPTTPVK